MPSSAREWIGYPDSSRGTMENMIITIVTSCRGVAAAAAAVVEKEEDLLIYHQTSWLKKRLLMQSPTRDQSPRHQNQPEEEEEVPPIRSEMVWIVSVGTRPELDFVQVSPIVQQVGYYFLGGQQTIYSF